MYSKILAPTDGSERSAEAIRHAAYLAAECDAGLHGLFVTDSGPLEHVDGKYPDAVSQIEAAGEQAVARVADVGDARGVETTTSVVSGTVPQAIVEYVDDHDIDVVVMATHSREGVKRHFLGSTTERLIRILDVPVLAVSGPST